MTEYKSGIIVKRVVRSPCTLKVHRTLPDRLDYGFHGHRNYDGGKSDSPGELRLNAPDWHEPRRVMVLDYIRMVDVGGSIECVEGECILDVYWPPKNLHCGSFSIHLSTFSHPTVGRGGFGISYRRLDFTMEFFFQVCRHLQFQDTPLDYDPGPNARFQGGSAR